jgi:hypothetical protein
VAFFIWKLKNFGVKSFLKRMLENKQLEKPQNITTIACIIGNR